MHVWLQEAAQRLARRVGLDTAELELDAGQIETLLALAAEAAHASGARVNAPLLCYLVGRAEALGGVPLAELAGLLADGRGREPNAGN